MPLIYNLYNNVNNTYKKSGDGVTPGRSNLDYGYSATFSHYFTGSFGFGAEVGMVYGKIVAPDYYDFTTKYITPSNYYNYNYSAGVIHVEQLKLRTLTIMPKLEFTFLGDQLPIGINHQFGAGISISKLIENDYNYSLIQYYSDDNKPFDKSMLTPYNSVGRFYNLTALYAFNVRTPITKSLMINYGLKYTLNFALTGIKDELSIVDYNEIANPVSKLIKEEIRQKKSTSLLSFNIGLTYVF